MRFGFQTILWDPHDDLSGALPLISAAGFSGVEIAQGPDDLGDFEKLVSRLDKYHLRLIGLAGGSLERRMEFMPPDFFHGDEKPYLYIDDWLGDSCARALHKGYRLALHSHYPGRATRLAYAWQLLEKHPKLEWLPDTAHLYINWADLEEAFTAHPERLAAAHIKDWTPLFGRSSYCVAKGFIEPGRGDVFKRFDLWATLDKANFGNKWAILEVDYARINQRTTVWACAQWLASQGKLPPPPEPALSIEAPARRLCDALWSAAVDTPEVFYKIAAHRLSEMVPCSAVSIWTNDSTKDECVNREVYSPTRKVFGSDVLKPGAHIANQTVLHGSARLISLKDSNAYPPQCRDAYGHYGVTHVASIPVLASYNKHQVRFVIHYLLGTPVADWPSTKARLQEAAADFGRAADLHTAELSRRAAALTAITLEGQQGVSESLKALAELMTSQLPCEGSTIFRADASETELREGGSTGIDWGDLKPKFQRYSKDDHSLTSRTLVERRPFLDYNTTKARAAMAGPPRKSREVVPHPERDACAWVPFLGRGGKLLGVVRCRNKLAGKDNIRAFTEDDLTVIQTICEAAAPILEMRIASEQRQANTEKLYHELATPLGAVRAAIHGASREIERRASDVLSQPFLSNAMSWTDLMIRLLQSPIGVLDPRPRETLLFRGVIIGAVKQTESLLVERSLSGKKIDYGQEQDFKILPPLNVDPNMFQQVFFNLLTNAIKYVEQPSQFMVKIRPGRVPEGFHIYFQDWGIGIREGWEEVIFEEGVRGEGAAQFDVQGRGLGLWVVREILAKHQCTVRLTKRYQPTEFTIFIPASLRVRY